MWDKNPMNKRRAGALVAVAATLAVAGGALSMHFSSGTTETTAGSAPSESNPLSLEQRIAILERELRDSSRIQQQLLELVEELHRSTAGESRSLHDEERNAIAPTLHGDSRRHQEAQVRNRRAQQYRDSQLQRLIDAGMNPSRAQFVLEKTERFQFEHTKLSYQYRHLADKSSEEALALRKQLEIHSNPRQMFSHLLSPEEFELYLQANGGGQEVNINRIVPNTPAHNAGLQAGDRIVSYNGQRIFHMGDLRQQVYRVPPGKTVAVEIQRAGSNNRETIYVPSGPLGIQG